jgi:hypothetical protein
MLEAWKSGGSLGYGHYQSGREASDILRAGAAGTLARAFSALIVEAGRPSFDQPEVSGPCRSSS